MIGPHLYRIIHQGYLVIPLLLLGVLGMIVECIPAVGCDQIEVLASQLTLQLVSELEGSHGPIHSHLHGAHHVFSLAQKNLIHALQLVHFLQRTLITEVQLRFEQLAHRVRRAHTSEVAHVELGVHLEGVDRVGDLCVEIGVTERVQRVVGDLCAFDCLIEVVVLEDLLDLVAVVAEVGAGIEALGDDGHMVVEFGGLHLALDGSDVDLLLVDHDHHLPLIFVLGHASEFGAPELLLVHVPVLPLGLLLDDHLGKVRFLLDGSE